MAPRRGDLIRPLLCATAAETRAWCRERGIAAVRGSLQRRPRVRPRAARSRLVPALAAVHPAAEAHVAAFAERLRDEAELLGPLVDAAWARAADDDGLSAAALAGRAAGHAPAARAPPGGRGRAARAGRRPAEPLERALALLAGPPGAVADLGQGAIAALERGRLVAHPPRAPRRSRSR